MPCSQHIQKENIKITYKGKFLAVHGNTFIQILKSIFMLVESIITVLKSHINKICFKSLKHRKLGIKAKMPFFSEPAVLRFCSWPKKLKTQSYEFSFTWITQGKYCKPYEYWNNFKNPHKTKPQSHKQQPLGLCFDCVSSFPPVFMLHTQSNWEARCGRLSKGSLRYDPSMTCSPIFYRLVSQSKCWWKQLT